MNEPKKLSVKNGVTARQKLLKVFVVDYTSDVDDVRYKGQFTTKKLSIADLSTIGVRKAQLNAGMHHDPENPGMGVDAQTDDFNSMIAHLDLALQEFPEWWDLSKISDGDLLAKVFEEVVSHENSFRLSRRSVSESSEEGGSGDVGTSPTVGEGDQEEAKHDGAAGSMVDEEVSTALEP